MKKKIYYIIYSIVQVIINVFMLLDVEGVAKAFKESLELAFTAYPEEMAVEMMKMFTDGVLEGFVIFSAILGGILALGFLILAIRNKMVERKVLAIVLVGASIFTALHDLVLILAVIALVLLLTTKSAVVKDSSGEVVVKEKKKIQKLRALKVTSKDQVLSIVLVLAYCTQFVLPAFINSDLVAIICEIAFRVIVFALVFYVFAKRFARDTRELKANLRTYVGYAFKWWAIMLGLSFVAVIIRMLLGADSQSANQATLNSLPLWYVVPLSVIWAPIVEEGIFRGVLRRFVKNDKLFVVLSAIIFGLLHTVGQEVGIFNTIVQSLQYMVMGGVLAYVYTKTNNIWSNILVHGIQNSFASIMMILLSLMA